MLFQIFVLFLVQKCITSDSSTHSANLIYVHSKEISWNTLMSNGGFETDKLLVAASRGSLINVLPSGWSAAHGVSLIAYKSFPKYLHDHGGEIYLAMQSVSGYLAQEVNTASNLKLKLSFSVLSYCLTSECVQNGISIYAALSSIPIKIDSSRLIYQYISDEMNVWLQKTIMFTAPADTFNLSFNAFSDGPRSSGILLDNIALEKVEVNLASPVVTDYIPTSDPTSRPSSDEIPIISSDIDEKKSKLSPKSKTYSIQKQAPAASPSSLSILVDSKPPNPFSTKIPIAPALTISEKIASTSWTTTASTTTTSASGDASNPSQQSAESVSTQSTTASDNFQASQDSTDSYSFSAVYEKRTTSTLTQGDPDGCPVHIRLLDSWGDGWHGAVLLISNVDGVRGSFSYGITDTGLLSIEPHVSIDGRSVWDGMVYLRDSHRHGDSVVTIGEASRKVPRESWEIFWTIELSDGDVLVGNADTVTTLSCSWEAGGKQSEVVVTNMEKPIEDHDCTRCAQNFDLNAASKTDSSNQRSFDPVGIALHDYDVFGKISMSRRHRQLGAVVDKPVTVYHPVYVDILNTAGRGWFNDSIVATYYTISDSTRTKLLAHGTLCGLKSNDRCVETLPNGDYIFRVGGNLDPRSQENAWEFCAVRGASQQELTFSIVDGNCVAGTLTFANEVGRDFAEAEYGESISPMKGYDSTIRFDNIASTPMDEEEIIMTDKKAPFYSSSTQGQETGEEGGSNAGQVAHDDLVLNAITYSYETVHAVILTHFHALQRGEIALIDSIILIGAFALLVFTISFLPGRQRNSIRTSLDKRLNEIKSENLYAVSSKGTLVKKKSVRFVLGSAGKVLNQSELGQTSTNELGETSAHPLMNGLNL